ncbi:MAG: AsmA family protein [Beijerinckiaceae bacterium]
MSRSALLFFREIITIIAGVVALALAAALAVPHFVDWNAHKPFILESLEKATGAKIVASGPIDLKLLPSPQLRLGEVAVSGREPGAPRLEAHALRMELGLTALLRGQFRFVDATLDRPQLTLTVRPDGTLIAPAMPEASRENVAFERIVLNDAEIALERPGARRLHIKALHLEASGQSLQGPFRGAGRVAGPGGSETTYSFNTGVAENGLLRLMFVFETAGLVARAEFDGALHFELRPDAAGGKPGLAARFEGKTALGGALSLPGASEQVWRASGPLVASAAGIKAEQIELRAGDEDHPLAATGAFEAVFGDKPHSRLVLAAQQIDADRLFSVQGDRAGAMRAMTELFRTALARPDFKSPSAVTLDVDLSTPALTVGGETLTNLSLRLSATPGRPSGLQFSAGAPGNTAVTMAGTLETGTAPVFRGAVSFSMRDKVRLAQWLAPGWAGVARIVEALPYRAFEVKGKADISKIGISARGLELAAGRSKFAGDIVFTRAVGNERTRLHADVNSPALDIDGPGEFADLAQALGDTDFSIAFDAKATRLARFGKGTIDAGDIALRMERNKGAVKLTRLDLRNLGGANLAASGDYRDGKGQVGIALDADNLVQLAHMLDRVAPGPWTRALTQRAAALSPAKLTIRAAGALENSAAVLSKLEIAGTLNGTQVKAAAQPGTGAAGTSGQLSLSAVQAPVLLRQLGLEALSISDAGKGVIEAAWKPAAKTGDGALADVTATIAGTSFSFAGNVGSLLPQADVRGRLSVSSEDAGPLLQALALGPAQIEARAPVGLSGAFAWRGGRLSAGGITGSLLGSKLIGNLAYAQQGDADRSAIWMLGGALRFDRLSLRGLAGLVLGGGGVGKATGGALWNEAGFHRGTANVPKAALRIQTGVLELPAGAKAENASFLMSIAPGVAAFDSVSLRAGGAHFTGKATIRKDKETAAVAGALTFDAPAPGLTGLGGRTSGTLDFAATGNSESELVAGLAGRGTAQVKDLRMASADPRALAVALAASDADELNVDEQSVKAALRKGFAGGAFAPGDRTFALTIAGGVLRFESEGAVEAPGNADAVLSGVFDFQTLKSETKLELTARTRPKDWNGALPAMSLIRHGEGATFADELSAGALINGMSARAIVREAARVEALEFDIRERAYFNRRAKAAAFLERRGKEILAYREEQIRLAEEARKKAEEEARRKAEEDAKRKAQEEAARRAAEAADRARVQRERELEDHKNRAEELRKQREEAARKAAAESKRRKPTDESRARRNDAPPEGKVGAPLQLSPVLPPR